MKNTAIRLALPFVTLLVVLVSCLEELEKLDKIESSTFQPSIDFPLVNSDFTMKEFITEGKSKAKIVEQNGVMVLTYADSLSTPIGENFFTLPNQQSPTISFTGPEVAFPSPGATITLTKSLNFNFNTSGEVLDSILLKAGQMVFQMSSTFPANISLTVSIPSLKTQNAGYQQNFSFVGAGSQNPSVNLQASKIDLTAGNTTTNTVTFSLTLTITDSGQPINSTHRFDCNFNLNSLKFRAMFGNLGTKNFQLKSDSIDVDVFDNAFNGKFELLSPSIRLNLQNSFGIPIGFDIKNILGLKSNSSVMLSGPALTAPLNPYLVNAPSVAQRGQSVNSQIPLTSSNSNLPSLVSSLPQYLAYQFNLTLNPGSPVKNFVQDDSKLQIVVDLELPFHGKVSGLSLTREYDFDGLGIEEAGDTRIKLKTINEAPLDAYVQVYFVSSTGALLDSLFTNRSILKGAAVDANGFTQGNAAITMEVPLTQAKIDRINSAEKLFVNAVMFTTNNGTVPVKFSPTDKLKVSIGVNTKLEYKIK